MLRVGIIGASGYTGLELMRMISRHPEFDLEICTAHAYEGTEVDSLYPSMKGFFDGEFASYEPGLIEKQCDVVFLGLPHGESMAVAPEILDMEKKVLDLSADFRLGPDDYLKWYGAEHSCPDLLQNAVYGLTELNRGQIEEAELVANPGCYPTAVLLGLLPLLKAELVGGSIVVDAKSGVSGAGRGLTLQTHFPQISDAVVPYAVSGHRHQPEIDRQMGRISSSGRVVTIFVPHLVSMSRGILCTMYVPLSEETGVSDLRAMYSEEYDGETFIWVLQEGEYPNTKSVQGSNNCHIGLEVLNDGRVAVVVSAIDNLVKGASGQAVQNMNLMCGFPEETGLVGPGLFP